MPNSNGEKSEKTQPNQEKSKTTAQNKRKRNRNRKKSGAKVENLVSKTFQAKLVANSSQTESAVENDPLKYDISNVIEKNSEQCAFDFFLKNNRIDLSLKNKPIPQLESSSKQSLQLDTSEIHCSTISKMVQPVVVGGTSLEKSREEILAEREAKKLAKQQAKKKNKDGDSKSSSNVKNNSSESIVSKVENNLKPKEESSQKNQKSQENAHQKELKNQESKETKTAGPLTEKLTCTNDFVAHCNPAANVKDKKTCFTKADRRDIQEAQRAAKAEAIKKEKKYKDLSTKEKNTSTPPKDVVNLHNEKPAVTKSIKDCKVKLFNHLESCREDSNLFINNPHIHPIIVRLGEQYSKRTIVGSNARCISFLSALKTVIQDYETPPKKEFARSLESAIKNSVDHLHKCRPLAVSVCNAYKHIKHVLTQLPMDPPESELKERLCHFVDTYIENQIGKAAQAISSSVQEKISNGDVILTFGCSSLINYIFEEAHRRHVDFRVIVVDSRPFSEGQELLRRLTVKEIPCTYVLINAVGFVMPEVTKILLGAHALLSNGYVMARTGTAQVALVARSFNVPVLVCCETHKFSERFQTDAIVYNELGNPNDLIINDKCRLINWQTQNKLSPLNLNYDITPPELVTAVVTEVAILPCTSVPVILRIKPTEIGY